MGRFPFRSIQGYQYILICYDYDSNGILTDPMNYRSEGKLLLAYTAFHTSLVQQGLQQLLCKLDNEAPAGLKIFMRDESVDFQPVP